MSLSFPATPTVGQMYNGLIWDGVKWTTPQGPAGLANIVLEVQLVNIQPVTAGQFSVVKYDTKITDLQNAYVPSTGLFTPRQAGLYLVVASYAINTSASAQQALVIVKNGATANAQSIGQRQYSAITGSALTVSASALIYCNGTTDTISVQGFAPTGITNFQPASAAGNPITMVATLLQVGPQGPAGTISSGNRVLLNTTIVSAAVASVDLTAAAWFNNYDELELHFWNMAFATESILLIRASTDGVTFDAGTNYINQYTSALSTNSGSAGGSVNNTGMVLGANNHPSAATYSTQSILNFCLVPNGSRYLSMLNQSVWQNSSAGIFLAGGAWWNGASACLGLRLISNGAYNITRGTFKLFGIVR